MFQQRRTLALPFLIPAMLAVAGASPAVAQSTTGYYAGKTVKMIIGLGAGGGYDLWARTLARHIGKQLPGNPTVISQNLEGAGSFFAPRANGEPGAARLHGWR